MSIRMRHTKGHTRNRRSHHALTATRAVKDAKSGALRLPHRLDETTGTYRGIQLFTPKTKLPKASREKMREKAAPPVAQGDTSHAHHEHHAPPATAKKGLMGKIAAAARPKARSGMGGEAS